MKESFYKLPSDLADDIESHAEDVRRFLSGDLAPGIFKARRVPLGIYEQRENGTYMMRVRVAGGTLSSKQIFALAELSNEFGNGLLHVTTRLDVQIHNVDIADTPEVMRRLMAVGLTSKGGGGNTVRNIVACPYAGICPSENFDVTPFAHAVTEYLIPLVGSYNLPRKYKIAFSGCSADCALARVNDLGFVAEIANGKPGFRIYAGGGMGANSRVADLLEEWMPPGNVIRVAEAVRRLFDRLGDRHDKHKARLRFVFDRIGVDAFRKAFHEEIRTVENEGVPECDVQPCVPARQTTINVRPDSELSVRDGVRFFQQSQQGYVAVPLHLPLGFISWQDFKILGKIAEQFSAEKGLRTTRSQNLLLRFVREHNLPDLGKALKQLEVDMVSQTPLERFTVCAGASTCRLGLCLSRNAAMACAEALENAGIEESTWQKLDINISGCPNACGHHPVGGIGLFGTAQRQKDRLLPSYRVLFGARIGEEIARLGEQVGTVSARALPDFLIDLATDYQPEAKAGKTFVSYFDKKGMAHFEEIVKRHSDIPSYEDNPEYYRDWGMQVDFSLAGRGAGECGAGVFEVVRDDITAARKAQEPFGIFLPTVRALLITRGVDAQDPDEIIRAFEENFVETGLISANFRDLLLRARSYLQGWREALEDRGEEIQQLLEHVEFLFSTLDADLQFHPPEGDMETDEAKNAAEQRKLESAGEVELDLRGVECPMNFVKAKLRLETMEIGDTLTIVLDEGEPVQNVPASFRNEGQEVLETVDLSDGHWQVMIKKNR